jgi:hypothetical protein
MNTPQDFQVTFIYCNDIDFHHHHDTLKEATTEYAQLLAEAIDPQGERKDQVHLRQITLRVYGDTEDELLHEIDSGVFECSHKKSP